MLSAKDVTKKSCFSEAAIASAPTPAPVAATVSRQDDINNKNNNVSFGSNKPPGWEWETIKGKGSWTGGGKRGTPLLIPILLVLLTLNLERNGSVTTNHPTIIFQRHHGKIIIKPTLSIPIRQKRNNQETFYIHTCIFTM